MRKHGQSYLVTPQRQIFLSIISYLSMNTSTITLPNNETIFYAEQGTNYKHQKPTLLFVHGNFSASYWWFDIMAALASHHYHIVAVDLRGFGYSSYNHPCNKFGDWALDLKEFCQLKDIKSCIAIGWSFGGGVSMKFAEIAPQIVKKIVLTCSVSHLGLTLSTKEEKCLTRQLIVENPKAKFMLQLLKTENRETMAQIWQSLLFTHSKDFPNDKKQEMITLCFKQRCYLDLLFALANSDINIENIKAKVLMVHGKQDIVVTLQSVKSTGEYFKNFVVWQNNAHMIPIENPQGYLDLITKFFEQV